MFTLRLLISLKGHFVGKDERGNLYYQEGYLFSKPNRRPHRWVIYKGEADPTAIPAAWHGWLHFTHEAPLVDATQKAQTSSRPKQSRVKKALSASSLTKDPLGLLKNRKKRLLPYVPWVPPQA